MAIATHLINAHAPGQQPGIIGQNGGRVNGGPGLVNAMNGPAKAEVTSPSDSDVDEARSREIAAKAVTGILITLLKWFKLSRTCSEKRDPSAC